MVQGDDPAFGMHGPDPECEVGRGIGATLVDIDRTVSDAITDALEPHTISSVCAGRGAPAVAP